MKLQGKLNSDLILPRHGDIWEDRVKKTEAYVERIYKGRPDVPRGGHGLTQVMVKVLAPGPEGGGNRESYRTLEVFMARYRFVRPAEHAKAAA